LGGASGLYLHPPQAPVPAYDEVEAVAVSRRLGDSEAQSDCLVHERQFGQFSQAFAGVGMGWFVDAANFLLFFQWHK